MVHPSPMPFFTSDGATYFDIKISWGLQRKSYKQYYKFFVARSSEKLNKIENKLACLDLHLVGESGTLPHCVLLRGSGVKCADERGRGIKPLYD